MVGARHRAVGVAEAHHQVCEAQRIEYGALGFIERHALLLAQRKELLRERGRERRGRWIDQRHAVQPDTVDGRGGVDLARVADQHDARDAFLRGALRGLQDARVFRLAQHDAAGRGAGAVDDAEDGFHGWMASETEKRAGALVMLAVCSPLPRAGEGQGVRAGGGMPPGGTSWRSPPSPQPSPASGRGSKPIASGAPVQAQTQT
ncbi:hypothetical protein D9M72_520420 [compost metagenome]